MMFKTLRKLFSPSPVLPRNSATGVLDQTLVHLTENDAFSVRDAVGGVAVFGGPGSGKSSGPAKHLILSYLASGYGGMALCAKPNEAGKWLGYAREAGRLDDVIVFSPEHPELRFNPLQFELNRSGRGGGYTQNVTSLFKHLLEISDGGKQGGGKDPFWERAVLELLSCSTDVLSAAGESVSLLTIHRLVQSCPRRDNDVDEFNDTDWRESSYAFQCLIAAVDRKMSDAGKQDLEMAATYLMEEFPRLPDKTRTSIVATFKGMAMPFLRSPLREIFGLDTTLPLEAAFDGAIIIVDYPIREFGEVGRVIGAMMKYFYQTAVERRKIADGTPACFLAVDEAQEFITSYDARFMATARESRCCTLFVTQNISNLYAAVNAQNVKFVVDSLLANFMTKVFCANADALTNQWAADLIAQSWQMKSSSNTSTGQNVSMGTSVNQQLAHQVLPAEFSTLLKGGPPEWIVETIWFQGGYQFHLSGTTYGRIAFPQLPDV